MTQAQTLSDIIIRYKTGLKALYPENEIRNITDLVAGHLLNYSKIEIHMNHREPISAETAEKFEAALARLQKWEPVQYVIGNTWFYELPFQVDSRVLIPRPETEELVVWIIRDNSDRQGTLLDIGTGSGCIAISLAKHLPSLQVSACDVSSEALEIAQINAESNKANVRFFHLDLLNGNNSLPGKFSLIVSNPPYVRIGEMQLMRPNVLDFEPGLALFAPEEDPLLFYRRIALLARKYLADGGKIYLEINEALSQETARVLENAGMYGIVVKEDLNGRKRMIRALK
jgi:release factor glutamine methyltransferase